MRSVIGTGGGAGPDVGANKARHAYRPALVGLLAIAAVWLTWWVTLTLIDHTGHAEATYLVVFLGGPVAILTTLVTLFVAGVQVAGNLLRRRRSL